MTSPTVPVTGYASVTDYELRTGTDVPDAMEPTIQTRLNDVSALMDLYMGDCAEAVADKYSDILTSMAVTVVYRAASTPAGVKTQSVGGTSVTFDTDRGALVLADSEATLLDALIEGACGESARHDGVGQLGINYGGPPEYDDGWPEDVDLWVMSGRFRR